MRVARGPFACGASSCTSELQVPSTERRHERLDATAGRAPVLGNLPAAVATAGAFVGQISYQMPATWSMQERGPSAPAAAPIDSRRSLWQPSQVPMVPEPFSPPARCLQHDPRAAHQPSVARPRCSGCCVGVLPPARRARRLPLVCYRPRPETPGDPALGGAGSWRCALCLRRIPLPRTLLVRGLAPCLQRPRQVWAGPPTGWSTAGHGEFPRIILCTAPSRR